MKTKDISDFDGKFRLFKLIKEGLIEDKYNG